MDANAWRRYPIVFYSTFTAKLHTTVNGKHTQVFLKIISNLYPHTPQYSLPSLEKEKKKAATSTYSIIAFFSTNVSYTQPTGCFEYASFTYKESKKGKFYNNTILATYLKMAGMSASPSWSLRTRAAILVKQLTKI